MFPMLRKSMSVEERAALGNECLAMFEQLMRAIRRGTSRRRPSKPHRCRPSSKLRASALVDRAANDARAELAVAC